jgi:glycosyltransferase involved in cell wall biosynthesis
MAARDERVPLVSIVIPTKDRHELLLEAVATALAQTLEDIEVIVVDDGSAEPVQLAPDRRMRLIRHNQAQGNAAARNAGLAVARGRWLTCLDDDDRLLPNHLSTAFAALARTSLPPPVASLSGVAVISVDGQVADVRLPPTMARGRHFSLEPLPPGRSYNSKQTLVVETAVLRDIGGWDPAFRSRTATELFFRLNACCSLQAADVVTYHLRAHRGPRVSRDPGLRQSSFDQLREKHWELFRTHPRGHADMLLDHAMISLRDGNRRSVVTSVASAVRYSPVRTARRWRTVGRAVRGLV